MRKHKNPFHKVKACPGCDLKLHKSKCKSGQVIGRGDIPADLLFIGEAPGKTEDMLGEPFVGPCGNLLQQMIDDACTMAGVLKELKYYITNTVLCRPWIWDEDDEKFGDNRRPNEEEVLACMPNIVEIAKVIRPSLVVFVGKISEQYYQKEFPESISITHPDYHLKFGGKSSPYYRTDIRVLCDAFEEFYAKV